MGDRLMAEESLKTKRHSEIIEKIDRECLNDTGLRVLEEIEVKTTIAKREVLLLERMLEKTIFQKEDVKVSQNINPAKKVNPTKKLLVRNYIFLTSIFLFTLLISTQGWVGFWIFGMMFLPLAFGCVWAMRAEKAGLAKKGEGKLGGWMLGIATLVVMIILQATPLFDASHQREQETQQQNQEWMQKRVLEFNRVFGK